MTLSEELAWRGFANQTTFETTDGINDPRTFYLGVDPSSDSMTIGNLAAVMTVKHLVRAGHKAIVLVGGATGMIGDPKEEGERDLKTLDEIAKNKAGIAAQYRRLLEGEKFELVDNYDWFKDIGYLDFLRDVGKKFSMTQLLDRDFVQARIGEGASGISYAEFSYSLIQGYDFYHLYKEKGATLQIGGSDQWGNMLSGIPLIRRDGGEAHVWTIPLVINKATGKKFGKSEGGAVWLDENKTSVFSFYQFWLNADDEGVIDYLKIYTMLSQEEIERLEKSAASNPREREAQKALAHEVTKLVHGEARAVAVEKVTKVLFGGESITTLDGMALDELAKEIPSAKIHGQLFEILVETGLASSSSEARRLADGGAISVNGEKVTEDITINETSLIKKGKNSFALAK